MEKYTAKDLMIFAHLTPLGMDALTDLVMNDMFGRDMNAIIDSAIIMYWQYVKEEENLGTAIDEPDEEENDVDENDVDENDVDENDVDENDVDENDVDENDVDVD